MKSNNKYLIFPYTLWLAVFVIIPLFLVVLFSFKNSEGAFTLENILAVKKYTIIFVRSLWMGFTSTLICLIFGYPMAYFISGIKSKLRNLILMLLMIPMWMSFLLRTYAWISILEHHGFLNNFLEWIGFARLDIINTTTAVTIGMVYNFLPFMILPIHSSLAKIEQKFIEAAQDLGANKLQVFLKVTLPLSIPGVVSGITMVFVPAVSTFIISKLLGGGSIMVIGDLIEMQFLGNTYNPYLGSAISLVLVAIIMLCTKIMNTVDKQEN